MQGHHRLRPRVEGGFDAHDQVERSGRGPGGRRLCIQSPPVPIDAPAGDLERLAGQWTGTYERANSDRAGSIEFNLVAGEDHAHGDVVMIPAGSHRPYQSFGEGRIAGDRYDAVQELTIRFVAVDGGEITGELDPYRDPDCDCRAYTRFRGRLHDDAVEGTFVTRTARDAGPVQGHWKVTRKRVGGYLSGNQSGSQPSSPRHASAPSATRK